MQLRKRTVAGVVVATAAMVLAGGCDLASITLVSGQFGPSSPPAHVQQADASDDGEIIVFTSSRAYDANDTNGVDDIFVNHRTSQLLYRVSNTSTGTAPNAAASEPRISGSGDVVIWTSEASDIVEGDTNGVSDVFWYDIYEGGLQRVSVSTDEVEGGARSLNSSISDDGRYVAFASEAANLIATDTNNRMDVFVRDIVDGTTTRQSVAADGSQRGPSSYRPSISGDGSHVAFSSHGRFVPGDSNGAEDIFLKDVTGPIQRISDAPGNAQANGSSRNPAVNQDGTVVAFRSLATNFDDRDTNGVMDIYVWDAATDMVELASISSHVDGVVGAAPATNPSIDDSGDVIGFSTASVEITGVANEQAVVRDRSTSSTHVVSTSVLGAPGNSSDTLVGMSGDGQSLLIRAMSDNLVADDTNASADLLVKTYPFPRVSYLTPDVLGPGDVRMTIEGSGFSPWASVTIDSDRGPELVVNSVTFIDSTTLELELSVPAGPSKEVYDLSVSNPPLLPGDTGASTTCYDCLVLS